MNIKEELEKVKEQSMKQQKEIEELKELLKAKNEIEEQQKQIDELKKQVKSKSSFNLPHVAVPKAFKRIIPFALIVVILFSVFTFYTPTIRADAPTVAYSSIGNGATFVDVVPGEGVYLTVNVSDGDGNLQSVDIYSNSSGSWASIYGSGALGGVAYHNTSSFLVSDWTGSWTTYYFNITGNDGSPVEFHYSFTTEYVFGGLHQVFVNDGDQIMWGEMYKNDTGEYYMALHNDTDNGVYAMTSTDGTDWALQGVTAVDTSVQSSNDVGVHGWHTYNGKPSFFYVDSGTVLNANWYIASWDGASWSTDDTGICNRYLYVTSSDVITQGIGADITYYDGEWQLLIGRASSRAIRLSLYQGTPPDGWSLFSDIITISGLAGGNHRSYWQPSVCILKGYLVFTVLNTGDGTTGPMRWYTFDGVSLVDKGNVDATTLNSIGSGYDITNNQIITVYTKNGDDKLYYRTLSDPTGSWSDEYLLIDNGATFIHPHISYIDGRMVITVANNIRGQYNIYNLYAPDYVDADSGTNTSYNRIQFPDAQPDATNVFSEVVGFQNINSRDILNVTWHFEDIGDLDISNNIKVYTNMSGGWASIGTCDASGDLAELDISGEMLGGGEWTPGMITYWKFEILDVGGIAETLHATDEDIYMLVDLADE